VSYQQLTNNFGRSVKLVLTNDRACLTFQITPADGAAFSRHLSSNKGSPPSAGATEG